MTLEQLQSAQEDYREILLRANAQILEIRGQLSDAARLRDETGECAPREWFQRASSALKHATKRKLEAEHQLSGLKQRIHEARERARADRRVAFQRAFIAIAKEHLLDADFQRLVQLAERQVEVTHAS